MPQPLKPKISSKQEELLWDRKILSLQSSGGLIQAVVFYLIKASGVFQGKDLRKLKTEHFKFEEDDIGKYVTIDFRLVAREGKLIKHYEDPNNPHSLYKLLTTYMGNLANEGDFLVRPISSIKDYLCYSPWPLGVANIENMIHTLMEEASLGEGYSNISVSLLAMDVLKSYGAGRHCLAPWSDCLSGVNSCYRPGYLGSKIAECTTINCRDKNREAGLIMSHLLDPPYPSGSGNPGEDLKAAMEENGSQPARSETHSRVNGLSSSVSNADDSPLDDQSATKTVSKSSLTMKRKANGSSILKKKRMKGSSSLNRSSMQNISNAFETGLCSPHDTTMNTDSEHNNVIVKTEIASHDIDLEVEIENAEDYDSHAAEVETFIGESFKSDEEALYSRSNGSCDNGPSVTTDFGLERGQPVNSELSVCGKGKSQTICQLEIGDIHDNEELQVTGYSHVEEVSEDVRCEDALCSSNYLNLGPNTSSSSRPQDEDKKSESCPKVSSGTNVSQASVLSALEQWLGGLKKNVSEGSDREMNELLLQATLQLKDISDRVKGHNTNAISKKSGNSPKEGNTSIDAKLKDNLFKISKNVEDVEISNGEAIKELNNAEGDQLGSVEENECSSNVKVSKDVASGDPHDPSMVDNFLKLSSIENDQDGSGCGDGDSCSLVLSPPVLSPQAPSLQPEVSTTFEVEPFTSQTQVELTQANKEDDVAQTNRNKLSTDLVKFLESAQNQLQTLISSQKGNLKAYGDEKERHIFHNTPKSSDISTSNSSSSHGTNLLSNTSETRLISHAAGTTSHSKTSSSSEINQLPSSSLKDLGSMPMLRSVLEKATLPPSYKYGKDELVNSSMSSLLPGPPLTPTAGTATSLLSSISNTSTKPSGSHSGMYTFHSDNASSTAFQSLTIVSGASRSQTFTFPELPLVPPDRATISRQRLLKATRSQVCLGDYLPRGALVPANGVHVVSQQSSNGLEVVLKFDFVKDDIESVKGNNT